jgi:phosphatidylserine/phosphatidylglycerophosphate/cardiolipin synthase-like enzyme
MNRKQDKFQAYYTNCDHITSYMVGLLECDSNMSVLEPCAGDPAKVVFLDDVKAATQARIDLIAKAQTEIQISTHVLSEDLAGNRLFAELVKAARRGVRVKVLYDAWENKKNISPAMIQALEAHGVQLYQFRPLKMGYFWNLNRRLHDKLFIVDRQHLIQGDRKDRTSVV